MANSLLSGVSGMKAHQKMIDVAGNNLANLNTNAFKSSRVTFAEMLSETIAEASQPTASRGGTNPQQIGSGVQLAAISRNMNQGSLVNTGEPLDMMIEGEGYFTLYDGQREVYTRVGSFGVDADNYLVDPNTGYRVQRIGNEGVAEGFQTANSSDIRLPYDVALPAQATTTIDYGGNLSADDSSPTTNLMTSGFQYTKSGAVASSATLISDLDQYSAFTGDLVVSGTNPDGTAVSFNFTVTSGVTTLGDLITAINANYTDATASIVNGEIRLTDDNSGYSQTNIDITPDAAATGSLTLPDHFEVTTVGGLANKTTNIEIFDSQGMSHILSATLVKSDTNKWDMVLSSITGDVQLVDRRIRGITFNADSSYGGLDTGIGDVASFQLGFSYDGYSTRTISVDLGSIGEFNGLSQFGGTSTAAPSGQDGYAAGTLSSVSVTREGIVTGMFTNGVRKDVAAIKVAVFQNPGGLQSVGSNYYEASANSGDPVPTRAMSAGAGAIRGSALEGSNVDTATEFVTLIQAQNGYQANARTIKVSNEMLKELTNLIR